MTELLKAINVSKVFGSGGLFKRKETVALENMHLSIRESPPSVTGVVGESGSGKTTLVRLLMGLLSPTEGEVLYRGRDLQKMSRDERLEFRREVQIIFQDPFEVYNPFYKVDHVLTTPVTKFHLARSKSEAQELIDNALEMIGLHPEETLGRYPRQMSGGQRQRVMVARASLLRPRIILADEPVSMVDASLRATILESLRKLSQEFGTSLLYITHDVTTAYQVSDNIIVIYKGSVVEIGDAELVIKNPQHPYTRLLVASIPLCDPDQRWGQNSAADLVRNNSPMLNQGCKFADRCPFTESKCRTNHPPLFQTDGHRAVRCFLYEDSPVISGFAVGEVFVRKE
jgi:oligopeptide/dipeptide ABC transporter ATP-binding protein